MAKPKIPTPVSRTRPEDRLKWPQHPNDLADRPRLFRIHRLNSFEWQAYVIQEDGEYPIGKPDLFDILSRKVAGVMRAEGQREFLAERTRSDKDANARAKGQVPDAQ